MTQLKMLSIEMLKISNRQNDKSNETFVSFCVYMSIPTYLSVHACGLVGGLVFENAIRVTVTCVRLCMFQDCPGVRGGSCVGLCAEVRMCAVEDLKKEFSVFVKVLTVCCDSSSSSNFFFFFFHVVCDTFNTPHHIGSIVSFLDIPSTSTATTTMTAERKEIDMKMIREGDILFRQKTPPFELLSRNGGSIRAALNRRPKVAEVVIRG